MVVSNIFYFHPYLGKISNLTNIFQMGWNHQLVYYTYIYILYTWVHAPLSRSHPFSPMVFSAEGGRRFFTSFNFMIIFVLWFIYTWFIYTWDMWISTPQNSFFFANPAGLIFFFSKAIHFSWGFLRNLWLEPVDILQKNNPTKQIHTMATFGPPLLWHMKKQNLPQEHRFVFCFF